MCSVCGGRRAAGASPIRCVGERITATGVPEFREVAWRAWNLRSGLLRFLCLVTNGTQRHQEIPVLRDHIEKQNKGNNSSQKHLYVYDKAVTDFVWWDRQKRHANYMISMLKENSIATLAVFFKTEVSQLLSS
ncbi:hypothetical protein [Bathymodiolus japonicus methanotrophic gill symbiont]|uniref:hypothetical protein n=1 Tax=Bathymodiolus japonicus methanotrophic gill symbiont TaxID=113269 RepID=UPI001C8E9BD6|nr:hypothetical protein [Bathymodiolus japonicus methanotrophic gill symbiont]